MDFFDNIQRNEEELSNEQLKKYISGEASAEEAHAVEKEMADSNFMNDAVEGLQSFSSQKKLDDYVTDINKKLHQQLEGRKQKKEKQKIKDLSWIIIAVIIILLLCIIGYFIIRMQREKEIQRNNTQHAMIFHDKNRFIL